MSQPRTIANGTTPHTWIPTLSPSRTPARAHRLALGTHAPGRPRGPARASSASSSSVLCGATSHVVRSTFAATSHTT